MTDPSQEPWNNNNPEWNQEPTQILNSDGNTQIQPPIQPENIPPAQNIQQPAPISPNNDNQEKPKKKFYQKWWFWLIVVLIIIAGFSGGNNGSSTKSTTTSAASSTTSATPQTKTTEPKAEAKITGIEASYLGTMTDGTVIDGSTGITVKAQYDDGTTKIIDSGWNLDNPGPINMNGPTTFTVSYNGLTATFDLTANPPVEYQSALTKAQQYSEMMHMSKAGIYDQLTSEYGEKFSAEAAQYAVDHLQADYNANALAKAKDYQDQMQMSPEAIRDQLTSEYGERFTPEEADYAIQHLND